MARFSPQRYIEDEVLIALRHDYGIEPGETGGLPITAGWQRTHSIDLTARLAALEYLAQLVRQGAGLEAARLSQRLASPGAATPHG